MKNRRRDSAKILEDNCMLVRAAIEKGALTRAEICKATGLRQVDIVQVFTKDRKLYADYQVIKKTIALEASDALHDIVRNPRHPQHFQACKFIVQSHKSDLDELLESKDSVKIEAEGGEATGGGKASRVVISFES